jgi:hypothetical protein
VDDAQQLAEDLLEQNLRADHLDAAAGRA